MSNTNKVNLEKTEPNPKSTSTITDAQKPNVPKESPVPKPKPLSKKETMEQCLEIQGLKHVENIQFKHLIMPTSQKSGQKKTRMQQDAISSQKEYEKVFTIQQRLVYKIGLQQVQDSRHLRHHQKCVELLLKKMEIPIPIMDESSDVDMDADEQSLKSPGDKPEVKTEKKSEKKSEEILS